MFSTIGSGDNVTCRSYDVLVGGFRFASTSLSFSENDEDECEEMVRGEEFIGRKAISGAVSITGATAVTGRYCRESGGKTLGIGLLSCGSSINGGIL